MHRGFRVLDSDIHVLEPPTLFEQYVDPPWRAQAPRPTGPDQPGWWVMDDRVLPAHADSPERRRALALRWGSAARERLAERADLFAQAEGTTPELMLEAMETEGIDVAVVFRTFAAHAIAVDGIDPELSAALCRAFNRWLGDFCASDPARLRAGAQIPVQDPELAVAEARHAVEELGAATLVLPSHVVEGRPLYDRTHDRLWAAAQDLDVPVSFHGIQAAYAEHILSNRYHDNHVLGHAVAQPVELMLALGAVITGGVAARFPRLRFAFLEGNCGWLPWWLYALDERWKEWGDRELFGQDELPSELFARQCWISMDPDEQEALHTIGTVGGDRVVISTDWPHDDSAYPHAIETFLELGLSDETRRRVLWDNTAELYGIEPPG